MFVHIFGFRWAPETTEEQKARARKDILAFRNQIPGLHAVNVGPNLSLRGRGYEFVGLMTFIDRAAYEAYTTHPMHMALLEWLAPVIEPVELDFQA